jgi:hypothetical protein
VTDIKTGNAIQIERREARYEKRRDGSRYERPNYQTIAQSKAYRNAVLALVPQDVIIRWKAEMLKLRKSDTITSSVIDEKRQNVLRFAAQHSIALDRRAVQDLTLDQIAGLGDAAREGALPAFANSARALGLEISHSEADTESGQAAGDDPQAGAATPRRRGRPPGPRQQQQQQQPPMRARKLTRAKRSTRPRGPPSRNSRNRPRARRFKTMTQKDAIDIVVRLNTAMLALDEAIKIAAE